MSHVSSTLPISHDEIAGFAPRAYLGHIDDFLANLSSSRAATKLRRNVAAIAARILLGLIFVASGVFGLLLLHNPPPAPPGLAGIFQDVFFRSHWVVFVDAAEALAGALLLANRYVPLALTVLAGILYNIYAFHITMMQAGLVAPVVVTALWLLVAWPLRSHFAPLLTPRTSTAA